MLISQRRFTWGVILILLVLAAFLNSPTRSWLHQAIARGIFDSELAIGSVRYHAKSSVLEAVEICWTSEIDQHLSGFRAKRAWVAIESEDLIDRRIIVPRIQFEQAELFFHPVQVASQPAIENLWQHDLAALLKSLDWEDVQRHFGSLLSATEVEQTWSERIARWKSRSLEILKQVRLIDGTNGSNPLRNDDEFQRNLITLDSLADEQKVLIEQFAGIQKLLQSECGRLENDFETELSRLDASIASGSPPSDVHNTASIAESILEQVAGNSWRAVADFGEIAASLPRIVPGRARHTYDLDVRDASDDLRLFELSNVHAEGLFDHRGDSSPFRLSAVVSGRYTSQHRTALEANWNYQFLANDLMILVTVLQSEADQVHVYLTAFEQHVGDALSPFPDCEAWAEREPRCVLQVRANKLGIEGDMKLSSLSKFASPCTLEAANLVLHANGTTEAATIAIAGSWAQPCFNWPKPAASQLALKIETLFQEQQQSRGRELEQEVRLRFETQLARLYSLVDMAAGEGKVMLESHRPQVADARKTLLLQSVQDADSVFADRPRQSKTR